MNRKKYLFLVIDTLYLFIHSSVNGYLYCFPNIQLLAIVNSATMNIHVQIVV